MEEPGLMTSAAVAFADASCGIFASGGGEIGGRKSDVDYVFRGTAVTRAVVWTMSGFC